MGKSLFVIGDRDTVLGLALMGVGGKTVTTAEEARGELERNLDNEEIALLLVTREWADVMRERIDGLKMESLRPIVMEIPGKAEGPPGQTLAQLVYRVIGIKI